MGFACIGFDSGAPEVELQVQVFAELLENSQKHKFMDLRATESIAASQKAPHASNSPDAPCP